jgi:hypothetical protein
VVISVSAVHVQALQGNAVIAPTVFSLRIYTADSEVAFLSYCLPPSPRPVFLISDDIVCG